MMSDNRFYTRILTTDDYSLLSSMENIELKTQKNAWAANQIAECFDNSYLIIGLFGYEKLIGLITNELRWG